MGWGRYSHCSYALPAARALPPGLGVAEPESEIPKDGGFDPALQASDIGS